MRFLRQLFIPRRADAVTLLAGILVVMASGCIILMLYDVPPARGAMTPALLTPFMLTVLCSIAYSIGAAAGCKQISLRRMGILLIAAIPFWALTIWATIQVLNHSSSETLHRLGGSRSIYSYLPFRYDQRSMYFFALPLVAAASFAAHWFFRVIIDRLFTRKTSSETDRQPRIRWMIGLAILMFVFHLINQFSEMIVARIFLSAATNLLPILFLFWISETFTGSWRWLRVFFALVLLPALSVPFWDNPLVLAGILIVTVPVLLGLLASGCGVSRNQQRDSEQPNDGVKPELPFLRISLWGLLPALALSGLAAFPWLIHIPTLLEYQSLEVAWRTAQFARSTESRCTELEGATAFEFDFSNRSSNSALTKVDKLFAEGMENPLPTTVFVLKNVHPKVETDLSNIHVVCMILENGTIEAKQLPGLASSASSLMLKNVTLKRGELIKPELGQLFLSEMSAEQMQAFFDSLDPETNPCQVHIRSAITPEQWLIIAKASLRHQVNLSCWIAEDDLKSFQRAPVGNLNFWYPIDPATLLQSSALCDSDISFHSDLGDETSFRPLSSVLEAKLLLRGLRCRANASEAYKSINDWTNDQLLVFERGQSGEPLGLLCPFSISNCDFPTKGLKNLKTLMLGVVWLNSENRSSIQFGNRENLTPETFSQMPNLERLSISPDCVCLDLKFLAGLPKLKHLEMSMHSIPPEEYPELEWLQGLERLTVHNDADEVFFKAVSRLKALKQLTLVFAEASNLPADNAAKVNSPEELAAKYLPGVEFTLVKSNEFRPEVPATLKAHFTRVIEELKAKIAAYKEKR